MKSILLLRSLLESYKLFFSLEMCSIASVANLPRPHAHRYLSNKQTNTISVQTSVLLHATIHTHWARTYGKQVARLQYE